MKPDTAGNGRAAPSVLTPRQEAAALSLAAGRTEEQAARDAGCGSRTIRTWKHNNPEFRRRVKALRAEMTDRCLGVLVGNMASAAESRGFLSRKARGEGARYMSARAVIELAAKLNEAGERAEKLEEALARLEALDAGRKVRR